MLIILKKGELEKEKIWESQGFSLGKINISNNYLHWKKKKINNRIKENVCAFWKWDFKEDLI